MEASAVEAQQVEQAQAEPKLEQPEQPHLEPQTEPAATVSDAEVKTRLAVLLGKSDLATTTEKMLRKSLEKELGVKLDDRKALIRQQVEAYLASVKAAEDGGSNGADDDVGSGDGDASDGARPAPKRRRGSGSAGDAMGSLLSPALAEFLGVQRMARTAVVKKLWEYIREHNLQDPKNKRNIIVDAKLATLFTPPINMFSMNKQLSKHVFTKKDVVEDDAGSDGSGDDGDDDEPRPKKAARPRAPAAKKGGGGGGGFTKPLQLSEELAAATGQSHMSRGSVTKWLYAYINEHNLKDPGDKRYVLSDDTLQRLTGQDRFLAFGHAKLISQHFLKE